MDKNFYAEGNVGMKLKYTYVEPYEIKSGFQFYGGYVFSNISKNKKFILNNKTGSSILISEDLFNDIINKNCNDDLIFKLVQRGLGKFSESREIYDHSKKILPTLFLIDLTSKCNLNCLYCFRTDEELSNSQSMSPDLINQICNYIVDYCHDNNLFKINIQLWGGEPLLCLQSIKKVKKFFDDTDIHVILSIETNGTLISKEIAKDLYENNIQVGISIDGTDFLQNLQRPQINGKGSFDLLINGIENLKESGLDNKFGTITVVTQNTLMYLEEIIDYFIKTLNIQSVKFNLMKDVEKNSSCSNLVLSDDEIEDFINVIIKKIIQLNKMGYSVKEGNILQKIANLISGKRDNICNSNGCCGGKSMLSFGRDGGIYPCELTQNPELKICSLEDKDLIMNIKENLKSNPYFTPKVSDECVNCPWYAYCKGGCTSSALYKNLPLGSIDNLECKLNKILYNKLVDMILNDPLSIFHLSNGQYLIQN